MTPAPSNPTRREWMPAETAALSRKRAHGKINIVTQLTCGGGSICQHGRQRSKCKECGGGGGPVTILEAIEVEDSDWEEDPQEWVPMVEACLIGGPLGGKRKR